MEEPPQLNQMCGRGRGVKQGGSSFPAVLQVFVRLGFPSSNVTRWIGVQDVVLWLDFAMSEEAFYLFFFTRKH